MRYQDLTVVMKTLTFILRLSVNSEHKKMHSEIIIVHLNCTLCNTGYMKYLISNPDRLVLTNRVRNANN